MKAIKEMEEKFPGKKSHSSIYIDSISSIKVLLIEDSRSDTVLIKKSLAEVKGPVFVVDHANCLTEGFKLASLSAYNVILLDLGLPESFGLETLERVIKAVPSVPVVVLTGTDDESTGLGVLREGAQDYIPKNDITGSLLSRSLRYAIERHYQQKKIEVMQEEFLALFSHDIKNSIITILSCVSLAEKPKFSAQEKQKFLEYIRNAAVIAKNMLSSIYETHRFDSGKIEPVIEDFLLNILLDEIQLIFEPQAVLNNISLYFSCPAEVYIKADRHMIRRILYNLIGNSFKYTEKNGNICINIDPSAGDKVGFEIADDGVGIPFADQEKIFEKFAQVKGSRRGTGLGLYLVRNYLHMLGSEIHLSSEPEKGAKFFFSIERGNKPVL